MENKLTVRICTGTLCYLMGGAELQLLDEHLSPELLAQVEIKGSPCLGCCDKEGSSQAPFVRVGDQVVCQASLNKVVNVIKSTLESKQ